jgi:hypothetical protein
VFNNNACYLIDKVSVEFPDEDGGGDLLPDEVSYSSHYNGIINIATFFRERLIFIFKMIEGPVLFDKLESLALLAVNKKVVASTVEGLQSDLRGNTSKDALTDYTDSIAKDIGFFH